VVSGPWDCCKAERDIWLSKLGDHISSHLAVIKPMEEPTKIDLLNSDVEALLLDQVCLAVEEQISKFIDNSEAEEKKDSQEDYVPSEQSSSPESSQSCSQDQGEELDDGEEAAVQEQKEPVVIDLTKSG